MAEDDEDSISGIGFPLPLPAAFVKHVMESSQRHEMEHQDAMHGVYRALEETPLEHLRAFRSLIQSATDDEKTGGYWSGVIAATIARRARTCPACGKDHDAEAAALLAADKPAD